MGVNKIINSPVVNKLKICDLKSSRFLKYTAIIIITITTRVILYINQNIILIFDFGCETGLEPAALSTTCRSIQLSYSHLFTNLLTICFTATTS